MHNLQQLITNIVDNNNKVEIEKESLKIIKSMYCMIKTISNITYIIEI